jgi:hypothetical protein
LTWGAARAAVRSFLSEKELASLRHLYSCRKDRTASRAIRLYRIYGIAETKVVEE